MKTKIKRLLVLFVILVMSVAVLCACEEKIEGITIKTAPASSLVLNQDLDLSKGEILLGDKNQTIIKMDAEGVVISGFDKTKSGVQTVTVSYKGYSATFQVTVGYPVQVSEHVADYFVGDTLNLDEGRVRITRADGTQFTRNLNDTKFQIDFDPVDFETAGEKKIPIVYDNGADRYVGEFTVKVHAIESIQLNKPTKVNYDNYDDQLNLKGGSLTLIGNGGQFKKKVDLTDNTVTVSGFDPLAATEEHRTTPLEQTISVKFGLAETKTFTVNITYTDVLTIKKSIESLAGIDWDSEKETTYTQAQGRSAMDAMAMYLKLDSDDQYAIDSADSLLLARTALAYSYHLWLMDLANYPGAWEYADGEIYYTLDSYANLTDEIAKLTQADSDLYKAGEIIQGIIESDAFAEEEMGFNLMKNIYKVWANFDFTKEYYDAYLTQAPDYVKFKAFPGVFYDNSEFQDKLVPFFQEMVALYDIMKDVPAGFDFASATTHDAAAQSAIQFLMDATTSHEDDTYATFYTYIDSWKGGDGFFDLLFSYIFTKDNTNVEALNQIGELAVPKELSDMFGVIKSCLEHIEYLNTDLDTVLENGVFPTFDNSQFLVDFAYLVDLDQQLKALGDGERAKYMYDNIFVTLSNQQYTFGELVEIIKIGQGGYDSLWGGMVNSSKVKDFVNDYLALLTYELYDEVRNQMIESLFIDYAKMTTGEQSSIANALNVYYYTGLPTRMFEEVTYRELLTKLGYDADAMVSEGYFTEEQLNMKLYYTDFAAIIVDYYTNSVSGALKTEQAQAAFKKLLTAMDYYLEYGALNEADTEVALVKNMFKNAFNTVKTDLTGDALLEFETKLGSIYDLYAQYLALHEQDTAPTFGDQQGLIDELKTAILYSITGGYYATTGSISPSMLLFAHERVEKLVAEFMVAAESNAELLNLYNNYQCYTYGGINYTMEYMVSMARKTYVSYESSLGESYSNAIKGFYDKYYDIVFEYVFLDQTVEFTKYDQLFASLADWFAMSDTDLISFWTLDYGMNCFYQSMVIATALTENLTAPASALAMEMVAIFDGASYTIQDSLMYNYLDLLSALSVDTTGYTDEQLAEYNEKLQESKFILEEKLTAARAQYDALEQADKDSFATVKIYFDTLVAKCQSVLA